MIDFSKPMTQLLGSLGDLNQNLMGGFNIVAACSDNWRQSIHTFLPGHDDRLSKLEHILSTMRSSVGTAQAIYSEIGKVQKTISSVIDQQESTSYNLNQEAQASDRRARSMQSSVERRMGELGERINEIRDSDVNSGIPPSIINSLRTQ